MFKAHFDIMIGQRIFFHACVKKSCFASLHVGRERKLEIHFVLSRWFLAYTADPSRNDLSTLRYVMGLRRKLVVLSWKRWSCGVRSFLLCLTMWKYLFSISTVCVWTETISKILKRRNTEKWHRATLKVNWALQVPIVAMLRSHLCSTEFSLISSEQCYTWALPKILSNHQMYALAVGRICSED